jgi:hypothetical protein
MGKEETSTMKQTIRSTQGMVRRAFGLILELRTRHNARELLGKVITFLELLARGEDSSVPPPMLMSIRLVRLKKT